MCIVAIRIDEKKLDGSLRALKDFLHFFQNLGVEGVEIPVHGLNIIRHGSIDRKMLEETVSILREYDFVYSVHAPDTLNLMDYERIDLHESVLRSTIEFSLEIGARIVVYHAGQYISNDQFPLMKKVILRQKEKKKLLTREANILRNLSMEYPSISIAVENARPYLFHSLYCYGEKINLLKRQIEDISRDNVGIALDIGHAYLSAQWYKFNLLEEIDSVRDLIVHCHIHDNFGVPSYYHEKDQNQLVPFGRGDCHMPIGWGTAPIESVVKQITSHFKGLLVLEMRGRYYEWIQQSLEKLITLCSIHPSHTQLMKA